MHINGFSGLATSENPLIAPPMSQLAQTQAETLARNIGTVVDPSALVVDGNSPRVIFRSPLELTREQEERLLQHCKDRVNTLSTELGRDEFATAEASIDWSTLQNFDQFAKKFMAKQHFAHLMFHGHVEWRENLKDTIYQDSNLHMPLSKRIVMQQVAKAIDSITGTEPWWGAYDVGNADEQKALDVQRYLQYEFHNRNNLTGDINAALELTFIQGQQVGKVTYEKNIDYYETVASVAVGLDGSPIAASDGDYIYAHDRFVQVQDPITGHVSEVLERDGVTPKPPTDESGQFFFRLEKLKKRLDKGSSSTFGAIHYLDFLCPLNAESIEKADCVVHLYDRTVINLAHQYLQGEFHEMTPELQLERMKDVAKLVDEAMRNTTSVGTQNLVRTDLNEDSKTQGGDHTEPKLNLAECWIHFDVNGDGIMENLIVVMDREGNIPIYYDYAANMTPDGLRPFRALVINKVAKRWHGVGQMEVYERLQEAADLILNRWNLSQSSSGRLDVVHPELTLEGQRDPNFKLNYGQAYTAIDKNVKAEDVISSAYIRDIKGGDLQTLLQFLLQVSMNMSGVSNANDSRMAGLDTAKLATGIMHLEKSGNELFGKYLAELIPCIKDIVKTLAKSVLASIDSNRVYQFFEGEQSMVATLTKDKVRDIEIDVRIDLTKVKGEQDLARFERAFGVLENYYRQPFMVQQRMHQVVMGLLKAMNIKNVEEMVEPVDLSAPPPPEEPMVQPSEI